MAELLADKRSPNTCRAYRKDLQDFFSTMAGEELSQGLILQFLQLDRFTALSIVLEYKAHLIQRGLAEATVNRRLSALRSLVNYAHQVGCCDWTLVGVKGEKVIKYRDTTGISPEQFKRMLQQCDSQTLRGKRDYAMLCLLWDNALRRGELISTKIQDFDPEGKRLTILGKGRGTQRESVALTPSSIAAIEDWLTARVESGKGGPLKPQDPLFSSLNRGTVGRPLHPASLERIVRLIAQQAGISKRISPLRLRHASITAFLDASGGNIRTAQRLSRHAQLETLQMYDDNRQEMQQEASSILANLRK
ncbi:tyrosine-type recombinase/integrase [Spirulina subsalsa FACHB-351]|uniref:Tyrosine-type recombinase/integrase n=2 Tax=Spirulina subsalsa TaxID=54311 RepID=A0ABT3LBR8_9CYAN|nr:tyrosine-type recombinase/integrase [Spirulina subsalsa FACHB-351]